MTEQEKLRRDIDTLRESIRTTGPSWHLTAHLDSKGAPELYDIYVENPMGWIETHQSSVLRGPPGARFDGPSSKARWLRVKRRGNTGPRLV